MAVIVTLQPSYTTQQTAHNSCHVRSLSAISHSPFDDLRDNILSQQDLTRQTRSDSNMTATEIDRLPALTLLDMTRESIRQQQTQDKDLKPIIHVLSTGKFKIAEWPPIRERAVHSVFRECLCKLPSIYVFSYFPFGCEGRMWDLTVSVPDHCLSFYFPNSQKMARSILLQQSEFVLVDGILFHSRVGKAKRTKALSRYQLVLPETCIQAVLQLFHDST